MQTQSEPAPPGGWLAYCAQARDLVRQEPLPHSEITSKDENPVEGHDLAKRD